jgi:hypothetical protein
MAEIRIEITGPIIITLILPDPLPERPESIPVVCPDCGWSKLYDSPEMAKRGLAGHQAHCPGPHDELVRLRRNMGFNGDEE